MKGDPIIIMVRDQNCMVSVTIKDMEQKRIAGMSDDERSFVRTKLWWQVNNVLKTVRHNALTRR